ncbi:MAG: site-2 protease family protein [Spirochaetales bacterium]
MKWSFRVGRAGGIDLKVHATFFLLLLWVAVADISAGSSAAETVASIGFILALFACVTLHEFGHALAARRYGVATRDVTLLPIGGIARLERMPENPSQEFVVAIAGPLVNVVLALIFLAAIAISDTSIPTPDELALGEAPFLVRILSANVALALFNFLPAFPMDGGRIVRSVLAIYLPYPRATAIAASLGQFMALVFGFFGFLFNPFLIIIAVFVWLGAGQEQSQAQLRSVFGSMPVRAAMVTDYKELSQDDKLSRAVELLIAGTQTDFPVVKDGVLVGMLGRKKLIRAISEHGADYPVRAAMDDEVESLDENEMLSSAFERMQQAGISVLPVLRGMELVGLLTMENIGEYVSVASALGPRNRITADR